MRHNWCSHLQIYFFGLPHVVNSYISRDNKNNVDKEVNPLIEKICNFKYYFPSLSEPSKEEGTFKDNSAFATALLKGTSPTLLFHPGNYVKEYDLPFTSMFPLQFPFGHGDMFLKRPIPVSKIECIKNYMRVSLPQFRRQNFILVSTHMYHRIKSFETGYIKCQAAFQGHRTLAEGVSKVTPDEVRAAALKLKAGERCNYSDSAQVFLKTVLTSCVPIGHSNEAADYGRKQYMALWNKFGPASVFFTVSPCDECSFRMKLYATSKEFRLPSSDWPDEQCLLDFKLRKKLRSTYPGAGAIEFQSLMQIIIEDMIGWDLKQNKAHCGRKGVFGIPEAYGATTEEQDRTTLHMHLLLWILNFNKVRHNLFSQDILTREKAKKCLEEYARKVMSASYPDLDLKHCSADGSSSCKGDIAGVSDQEIRNMRHKFKCIISKGVVATCKSCRKEFTTVDLVNNSLNSWRGFLNKGTTYEDEFPLPQHRSDIYAMLFTYNIASQTFYKSQSLGDKYQRAISTMKFNEHDFNHRGTCFKKDNECRFKIPKQLTSKTYILFGEETSDWNMVIGEDRRVTSFDVVVERKMGDQYLNTFSPTVSGTIGYNTNVQIGDVAHIYYNTLYGSKSTQDEDTRSYLRVCNELSRRIKRQQEKMKEEEEPQEETAPDFCEGLVRILSGIRAHINSYIISPTLGHHIITMGSRFQFSHTFKPLLLAQMEDYIHGKM